MSWSKNDTILHTRVYSTPEPGIFHRKDTGLSGIANALLEIFVNVCLGMIDTNLDGEDQLNTVNYTQEILYIPVCNYKVFISLVRNSVR